jgi:anaerobic magnesium-protoporphyrin IX monomethyl ester cyclase
MDIGLMTNTIVLLTTLLPSDQEKFSRDCPPMGLLAIAAPLSRAGYNVVLIDPRLEGDWEKRLKDVVQNGVLLTGMSTFMGQNLKNALSMSRMIKQIAPQTPVVWGGPFATSSPEICLATGLVDFVVMGMGEKIVAGLADALAQGGPVDLPHVSTLRSGAPNVKEIYRFDGDLDDLDYPLLDLWENGIRMVGSIPIISSRGCPRNCAFCYNNTFTGRKKWLQRSARNVLDEMEHWKERFGLDRFYFVDDNFLVNTKRSLDILSAARDRTYKIDAIIGHLNDWRDEVIDLVSQFITAVSFSIESASPRIQKMVNKPIDLERALQVFAMFTRKEIPKITTNFMFGFPSETDEDISANIAMACRIRSINPYIRIVPYIYAPQPKDDIVPNYPDQCGNIDFSIETLSQVDFSPNRSNLLIGAIRPWMSRDDIQFYIDLEKVWFQYFDYVVRNDQNVDIQEIMNRDDRLSRLFKDVPAP